MNKNLFQDMVKAKNIKQKKPQTEVVLPTKTKTVLYKKDESTKTRHTLWFVALIAVVFLVFAVSVLFSKADITISPKQKEFDLNSSFSAVKEGNDTNLSFDTVILSDSENKTIQATGSENVSIKATGTVILYNAFSTTPQKLKIDTRLEGSNGKIYKTKTALVIPGMSADKIPGSVEAEIYADVAGVESNTDPIDFKIFGFKNGPKYEKFYGRSKGTITGGFVGERPQISEEEKTNTQNEIKDTLKAKLISKVESQLPAGFVLFPDAVFVDFDPNISFVTNKDNGATMTIKGTLSGFIFNEENLSKTLVSTLLIKDQDQNAYISNTKSLTFALVNKDDVSFVNTKNISFTLKGKSNVVWKVDQNLVLQDLINSNKKDFNNILAKYSNIASADLALRPIWKSTLPDKIEKINVSVNYPK